MDEQNLGVTSSTDSGSASPSSDVAVSSGGVQSESPAPSSILDIAQELHANNIADSSATPESVAQPAQTTAGEQPEPENAGDSATSDGLHIPENDDDLRTLTDATAKAHIEGLRQHVRGTLEPKAKQFDAQQAIFAQYGIQPEMVEPLAKISGGLLATTQVPVRGENGQTVMQTYMTTEPFWTELAQTSEDHLQQALYDAAQMFPGYLLQNIPREAAFQALGLNPQLADVYAQVREDGTLNGVAPLSVDNEILGKIPEDLRATFSEIAKADPEYAQELEFILRGETPRVAHQVLRTERFQREADAKERAANEQKEADRLVQVEQEGKQRIADFYEKEERAFRDDLVRSYNPFGTATEEAKADNAWIQERIILALGHELQQDPKANQIIQGLNDALKRGNQFAVTQLRLQLEPHITRIRNAEIERYDRQLRRSITADQQQRDANAKLKSVPNMGGFPEDRPGNGIVNTDNLNDPENFRALARSLGVHIGQ